MKKLLRVVICLALALIMSLQGGLSAYAAGSQELYVSEVVTCKADSYKEAKEDLEDDGYIIAGDINLNATLDTGIYLGYKTTDNPDEAITDLATMNMLGSYSYKEYKKILSDEREAIATGIDAILPAIAAYQDSLQLGTYEGRMTRAILNIYEEDDSGDLMGDYLADYDFSSEMREQLTEVFLQSNTGIMINIMNALAITAGDFECTSLDYLADIGLDGGFEEYKAANLGLKNAESRFETEYGETVNALKDGWDEMAAALTEASGYVVFDSDESFEFTGDDAAVAEDMNDILFYMDLKMSGYDEIADFFMTDYDESMLKRLYTVAYAMTDAQRGLLTYLSPLTILSADTYSYEEISEEDFEESIESLEDMDTISVYEGIDRSIYDDGVAFTSSATRHESLSGTPWYATESGQKSLLYAMGGFFAGVCVTATVGFCCHCSIWSIEHNAETFALNYQSKLVKEIKTQFRAQYQDIKHVAKDTKLMYSAQVKDKVNQFKEGLNTRLRVSTVFMYAAFILTVIFLILDIVSVILYGIGNKTVHEDIIPAHLVTAVTANNRTDYVYYTTVKDLSGDDADLNNHEGDPATGWLVLYSTKDVFAGDPIKAGSFKMLQGSSEAPAGYSCIHMFNEDAAVNMTSSNYTSVDDAVGGTYVYYLTSAALNGAVGTAFDYSSGLLIGLCGIAVGVIAGFFLGRSSKKKKELPAA